MPEDEHRRDVEVVVWRSDGEATAALDGLDTVAIHLDDEQAIARAVAEIRERSGVDVAVLQLTDTHLHVERLGGAEVTNDWRLPGSPRPRKAVWNDPGWFASTCAVVEDALAEAVGATHVGPVRQVKHWSISAILEVATDVGPFWFKQVPAFMAHEGALTEWLGVVRPGVAPDVVARGTDWTLSAPFLPPSEDRTLDNPYAELAELQLSVADRVDELLALGCPDRTVPTMVPELTALSARGDLLEPSVAERLAAAVPRIAELADRLDASPIPSSLVHGDLHSGNWTRRPNGSWLLFDWTDGCVAHPFLDLGVLPRKDLELRSARLEAFLGPWRLAFGDAAVDATLAAALPLGSAFQALSYQRIADGIGRDGGAGWHPPIASHLTALLDEV